MALPATRAEFKALILRQLGKTVVDEINVSDEQLDDAVDLGLSYYGDYHFDGSEVTYYRYQITDTDRTNKYITMPENIIGVVDLFPIGDYNAVNNIFSIRYQIALNDLYQLTNISLVPYYQTMQYLQMIEQILIGRMPIRYTRTTNFLHIDGDWTKLPTGTWIVVEAHGVIDPATYTDIWKDRWLIKYTTALTKKQYAINLSKFNGLVLPSGITLNTDKMYDDAVAEQNKLEDTMIHDYSLPPRDMIG